jgi:hypothetical protein
MSALLGNLFNKCAFIRPVLTKWAKVGVSKFIPLAQRSFTVCYVTFNLFATSLKASV